MEKEIETIKESPQKLIEKVNKLQILLSDIVITSGVIIKELIGEQNESSDDRIEPDSIEEKLIDMIMDGDKALERLSKIKMEVTE